MAVELATAYVSLVPSAKGLSQAIHKELVGPTGQVAGEAGEAAGTHFGNRFTSAVSTVAKAGALGLAAVGLAATKIVFDAIGAAEESRKVAAQTSAVIESTGAAANVSARQVSELVDALSAKAGVDDELIQSGANVLLTFTKVRNEVGEGNDIFNQATAVALDMSVALGQDLQSSVTQIGKALNDPIAGISALTRVGVQFTDQQKEQIATLIESGDVLGAQKVILAELTTQFGGSAEAQATATDKLKVAYDNVSEAIGTVLLPYVDQFSTWMLEEGVPLLNQHLIPAVEDLAIWFRDELVPAIRDEVLPRLADFGRFVRDDVLPALGEMWRIFTEDILPVFEDVATFIRDELVPPLQDLKDAIFGVNEESGDSGPSIAGWAAAFAAVAVGAAFVASSLSFLVPVIKGVGLALGGLLHIVTFIGQWFAAVFVTGLILSPLYKAVAGFWYFRDEVGAVWDWVYSHVLLPIGRAFEWLWGVITDTVGDIVAFVSRNWTTLGVILLAPFSIAVGLIIAAWDEIYGAISTAVGAVVSFVADHWSQLLALVTGPIGAAVFIITALWDQIVGIFHTAVDIVIGIWQSGWDTIWSILQTAWQALSGFFTALPGAIAGFFSDAVSWLVSGGRNIIQGLWNGILEVWASVTGWFGGVGGAIVGYFWNAVSWLYDSGKNIITGMWDGIKAVWSNVVEWFKDLPSKVLDALGIASPPQWAIDAGRDILDGIMKGAGLGVGNVMDFMSGLASRFTGPLKEAWEGIFAFVSGDIDLGADVSAIQDLAMRMAAAYGWTGGQWEALRQLVYNESGWRPTAQNPTSTAYGLFQFLDSTWASVGARKTSDPQGQIAAGLEYIRRRYGSPINALAAWNSRQPHWYAAGGVLPETGLFGGHRGEAIFNPAQLEVLGSLGDVIRDGMAGEDMATRPFEQTIVVAGVTDIPELARQIGDETAWTLRVAG